VLIGEHAAGSAEAGLDLVESEQHVVLATQLARGAEIAWRRDDDPGFGLNRLDEKCYRVRRDRTAQLLEIAEVDESETGRERPKVGAILRLGREADDRCRTAVKVVATDDDLGAIRRDTFDSVTPFAREFDRGLHRFCARVHR
jgi:hypothetical protein